MFQDILAAIPLGIVVAFLFGPVFFVLLETAAIKGARVALVFDAGVILADLIFILIAYFSTSKLLNSLQDDPSLLIIGGGILLAYSVITFLKERKCTKDTLALKKAKAPRKNDKLRFFIKGFLLNFINIGVLGFWVGLIIAFSPTLHMDPKRIFVFFFTVILTYFLVDVIKISLAKKLRHKLTSLRIYKLKRTISILILVFGMILIARGIFPAKMQKLQDKVENVMPDTAVFKQRLLT